MKISIKKLIRVQSVLIVCKCVLHYLSSGILLCNSLASAHFTKSVSFSSYLTTVISLTTRRVIHVLNTEWGSIIVHTTICEPLTITH